VKELLFDANAGPENTIHSLDPRAKILVIFALIFISVSTPPQALWAFAVYALYLLSITLIGRVPPRLLLKRLAMALPFVLCIGFFMPFAGASDEVADSFQSGWWLFWNLLVKALVGIFALSLLTATTRFGKILEGFSRLKAPNLLLMLLSFTYRYLFVLAEEAQRMKRARDARAYGGRWLWNGKVIGQMIGTLFIRSYERGERVYLAMCSRGYNGSQSLWSHSPSELRLRDYVFTILSISLILSARWGMT
jgi:cobalt/nickel transport system permease protein